MIHRADGSRLSLSSLSGVQFIALQDAVLHDWSTRPNLCGCAVCQAISHGSFFPDSKGMSSVTLLNVAKNVASCSAPSLSRTFFMLLDYVAIVQKSIDLGIEVPFLHIKWYEEDQDRGTRYLASVDAPPAIRS